MWANVIENYNTIINEYSDPRVKNWFLMSSPVPTLILCSLYLLIVKKIGPWLMRDRKPFKLQKILIVYNLIQVIFSTWIFYEGWVCAWGYNYSLGCQPIDKSTSPLSMRIARACWWYYFSKFTEFLDTFFFVLRKKYNQVSTLHVIHHGVMPIGVWIGVKFTPGGHGTLFGQLNLFVHIVMYSYYMLAAIGPQMQKFLWWKKYLTLLQMVQFAMVFVHSARLLMTNDCDQIKLLTWLILLHSIMFFCLFSNFYIHSYKKKGDEQRAAARQKKDDEHAGRKRRDDGSRPVPGAAAAKSSFWSNLATMSSPCFLPAVTDADSAAEQQPCRAYARPPPTSNDRSSVTIQQAFVSGESATLRDRAFVSRSSSNA